MRGEARDMLARIILWGGRLRVMTVKELLQLSRDSVLILFMIYTFTADIYLGGKGVSFELRHAATFFLDNDHSHTSRELMDRFRPSSFDFSGEVSSPAEGVALLDRGDAMVVFDIPPRFEELLLTGKPTSVQVQIDSTNSVLGLLAGSYCGSIVSAFGMEAGLRRMGLTSESLQHMPVIVNDQRVWFNPNEDDRWFMSIAELLNVVTLFAMLLPAAAMVREKERGTVDQLLVTPLSTLQIMLPKVLAMTLVIMIGVNISLFCVMRPFFHVPIRGSVNLFMAVTALYVFATSGLGLLIATIARNLGQAAMLTVMSYGPMIFLSGAWTPPEAMPKLFRMLMVTSPLHHYIDVSFGVLLKGAGVSLLWDSILGIAAFGAVLFGLGMWRLRRQF